MAKHAAAGLGFLSAGAALAQISPVSPTGFDRTTLTTVDAMASHEPMPDLPAVGARKLTAAELKKRHDMMLRRDAAKPDAMKSSMPH